MLIELSKEEADTIVDMVQKRIKDLAIQVIDVKTHKITVDAGYSKLSEEEKKGAKEMMDKFNQQYADYIEAADKEDMSLEYLLSKFRTEKNDNAVVELKGHGND